MANDAPAILTSQENAKRTLQIKVVADDSAMSMAHSLLVRHLQLQEPLYGYFRMKIGS
jgi:hypothetical protein